MPGEDRNEKCEWIDDRMALSGLTSLNSAICFCENKTKTLDGAFLARLEPEPRVDPLLESAGVAAEAGVSAAVSAADSAADPSSFAFFFLTFFSLSA